jgi:hypothetical protein
MNEMVEHRISPNAQARGCPAPEDLMALGGDAMPDDVRGHVQAHVDRCPACRALAADLATIDVDAPASLDERVGIEARTMARFDWLLPIAAALIAALGLATWLRGPAPRAGAVTTGRATSAGNVLEPSAPRGVWQIEKPAIALPLSAPIVMRGGQAAGTPEMAIALEPYRRDDFQGATVRLAEFARRHPDSGEGWFYLGASRLFLGDTRGARVALETARTRIAQERRDELDWLLATAEARSGEVAAARKRLDALCGATSALRKRACSAVSTLRP